MAERCARHGCGGACVRRGLTPCVPDADGEFRVVVRRHLGYEFQKNVSDRDIDEMRAVVNRHGSDNPVHAADLLWKLLRAL